MSVTWFIIFKWREASYYVWPPDKKVTPTNAGGTDLESALTVLIACSWILFSFFLGWVDPYVIIFGFNKHPSNKTLFFWRAVNVATNTL